MDFGRRYTSLAKKVTAYMSEREELLREAEALERDDLAMQRDVDAHNAAVEKERNAALSRMETLNKEVAALRKELHALQQKAANADDYARYPRPSRPEGYYSESNADASRIGAFYGPDGQITSERPHVHVIHSEAEGRVIFVVTQSDGTHTATEYLPISASGTEVRGLTLRLCGQLDAVR
ncbi:hypothetical protein D7I47_13345 [Protaetiibacter intestinalis]|uniref:Uncharacterized protein n=2 Tax=Protaetiibacter intestinalis TaxID=2419774 RepID=A0A387BB44_9MICO|nr:hypothetical protein D7I47_13345 [Protaetiibacter intestinalis]